MVKNPLANAADVRDAGSISGSGRSPGHGNSLQYSYLENPIDRGARWATVHLYRFAKSQIQLKQRGEKNSNENNAISIITSPSFDHLTMGCMTADLLKHCLCQPLQTNPQIGAAENNHTYS